MRREARQLKSTLDVSIERWVNPKRQESSLTDRFIELRIVFPIAPGTNSTLATVLETELIDGDRWVPLPTVADHGVEDDEQLPHAGDVGHLGRLPAVA